MGIRRFSTLAAVAALVTSMSMAGVAIDIVGAPGAQAASLTCTKTFTNTDANHSFGDANDWSPIGVPGTNDVACMSGYNVTVATPVNVGAVQGGVLVVDASFTLTMSSTTSTLDGLYLASGLTGPAGSTLTVNGDMAWDSSGNFQVNSGGGGLAFTQAAGHSFAITGNGQGYFQGGSVTTDSPVTIGDFNFISSNSPSITTTSTVTFTPGTYSQNGGAGTIINAAGFDFSGTTDLQDEVLHLTGTSSSITGGSDTITVNGFSSTASSSLAIPSGDTLSVASNAGNNIQGSISGAGTLSLDQGSLSGSVTVGDLNVPSQTVAVQSGATYDVGATTVDGGELDLYVNATTGTFTESGGAVYAQANPVTLSVTGAATWSGGQLQGGSGDILTLSQASGTTFTINGTAQAYLIGDTISTQSPVTISNPNFISTVNGSVAAALSTTSTVTFAPGTYSQNGGSGTAITAAGFIFTGSTTLQDENLHLTGTSSSITGSSDAISVEGLSTSVGSTLSIPSNDSLSVTNNSGNNLLGSLSGAGTLNLESASLSGSLSVASVVVAGGTVSVLNGSSYDVGGTTVNSGGLDLYTDATTGTFLETGGTVNAQASAVTLHVTGAATWSGGALSGAGGDTLTLSQAPGTTFDISGTGQAYLIGDTISTQSPVFITDPNFITTTNGAVRAAITTTSTLGFANGLVEPLNGGNGATFTAAGLAPHSDTSTYGTYNSVVLTGGASTIPSGGNFQTGPFSLQGGSLQVDGTLNSASTTVSGGTLSGTGAVGGPLDVTGGTVAPGDNGSVGTLSESGSFTMTGGELDVAVASAASYSALSVASSADVGGSIKMLTGSFTPLFGASFNVVQALGGVTDSHPAFTSPANWTGSATTHDYVATFQPGPDAPSGATATAGDGQATISWSAPSTNGGPAIASYTVTAHDQSNAAHGGQTCVVSEATPTAPSCVVTGLANGDRYVFTVTATNSVGTSNPSGDSNAVTPAAPIPPSVTFSPNPIVVDRFRTTTATCRDNGQTLTKCVVTVKSSSGTVIASGSATPSSPATSIAVTVTATPAGVTLASPVGGVTGTATATMTVSGQPGVTATTTLKLVHQSQSVNLAGSILFKVGSAVISPAGRAKIVAIGKSVQGAKLAECDGYTDNVGSPTANLFLSKARATAVCTILKHYVVATKVVGYGGTHPIASNKTEAGRSKNRRVTIKVSY